jgi:hypothetical protein
VLGGGAVPAGSRRRDSAEDARLGSGKLPAGSILLRLYLVGGTAQRSSAPMVAAALYGGRRGAQARKVAGWVLWAWSTGDRAVPGSDAEGWRQRDAPGLRRVRVWHAAAVAPDGLARRACGRAWSGRGLDRAGTRAGPRRQAGWAAGSCWAAQAGETREVKGA